MSDDTKITSIRQIFENIDWVTNWLTAMGFAVLFGFAAATVRDKLTFTAILLSLFVSALLAGTAYPLAVALGYGGFIPTMAISLVCGLGGFATLIALISVIRRYVPRYIKERAKKLAGEEADV